MEFNWIEKARSKIGTKEIKGLKNNPIIVNMWKLIKRGGIKDDETPWCAAFVGSCLEEAGLISSRYESASSYLAWGVASQICYGCIAVLSRDGGTGFHVGFVVGKNNAGKVLILGGNQGDEVSIKAFDPLRIKACRWPSPVVNPKVPLEIVSISSSSTSED